MRNFSALYRRSEAPALRRKGSRELKGGQNDKAPDDAGASKIEC